MAGDLCHQKIVEEDHVLRLLFGRGETPEAAETESPDVLVIHGGVDDITQPAALFQRRIIAVDDCHQRIACVADEQSRLKV